MEPLRMSGILGSAAAGSFPYAAALESAGIPFAWDPYPPESMPGFRPFYGAFDMPFSILVPAPSRDDARAALVDAGLLCEPADAACAPSVPDTAYDDEGALAGTEAMRRRRRVVVWLLILVFIGFDLLVAALALLYALFT
jgi:hypothetical protein